VKLAFCGHLDPAERLEILERRRDALSDRLHRARRTSPGRNDRYSRSLFEHRTQSTERDLEWVDALIAAEGRDDTSPVEIAPPSNSLTHSLEHIASSDVQEQGATTP
jgi:hypothetical protein